MFAVQNYYTHHEVLGPTHKTSFFFGTGDLTQKLVLAN